MSPFGLKFSQMILHIETSKLMYNSSFLNVVLHKPTLLPITFNSPKQIRTICLWTMLDRDSAIREWFIMLLRNITTFFIIKGGGGGRKFWWHTCKQECSNVRCCLLEVRQYTWEMGTVIREKNCLWNLQIMIRKMQLNLPPLRFSFAHTLAKYLLVGVMCDCQFTHILLLCMNTPYNCCLWRSYPLPSWKMHHFSVMECLIIISIWITRKINFGCANAKDILYMPSRKLIFHI